MAPIDANAWILISQAHRAEPPATVPSNNHNQKKRYQYRMFRYFLRRGTTSLSTLPALQSRGHHCLLLSHWLCRPSGHVLPACRRPSDLRESGHRFPPSTQRARYCPNKGTLFAGTQNIRHLLENLAASDEIYATIQGVFHASYDEQQHRRSRTDDIGDVSNKLAQRPADQRCCMCRLGMWLHCLKPEELNLWKGAPSIDGCLIPMGGCQHG